jgi:Mg-chelatase subunit ChlD/Flp pilus assembly protein TadD
MRFTNVLTLSIFVPILIGSLIMLLVTLVPINNEESNWRTMLNKHVNESKINSKITKMEYQSNFIKTFFQLNNNHIHLIKNNIEMNLQQNITVENNYETYFGVNTIDTRIPQNDYNSIPLFSSTFIKNINNQNDLNLIDQYIFKNTSIYDDILRTVYKSSKNYVSVYIGFEKNGFFRRFPYVELNRYQNLAYKCFYNNLDMIGYDPRCRIWYSIASNITKYTPPYIDALSGNVMITSSIKVMNSTELYCVIGIDFVMNSINNIILKDTSSNEYNFLIDSDGNIISYPNMKYDKVYNIYITEPILNKINLKNVNKYIKVDDKYIFVNYLSDLNYYLVSIYSEKNIEHSTDIVFNSISKIILDGTIAISIIICTMVVFNIIFIRIFSKIYSKPINDFTKDIKSIQNVNLDIELGNKAPISSEFTNANNKLKTLLTAVKFGNDLYYNGDLNKALESYIKAEELMKTLNIKRGLSICYNNKANVLKQLNRIDEAEKLYIESIKIAEEFIQTEKDTQKKTAWYVSISNRMMNLGVLYKDSVKLDKAEEYLNNSLKYANKSDNAIGKTKIVNNISQLYLQTGRIKEAESIINDTYQEIIKSNQDEITVQYAELNFALLELYKGNYPLAKTYFENILYKFKHIDMNLKNICIQNLHTIAQETKNYENMSQFLQNSQESTSRNITFLLDVSGSMAGNPINQCKQSINDIILKYLQNSDNISMYTFNQTIQLLFKNNNKYMNMNEISNKLTNITCSGGTAFYTGLEIVINSLQKDNNQNWIIALTDGEDNHSNNDSYKNIFKILKNYRVNIIIITIGKLDNRQKIEEIVKSISNNSIGKLVEINNTSQEIANVFQNVAKLIIGQLNVESL